MNLWAGYRWVGWMLTVQEGIVPEFDVGLVVNDGVTH